MDKTRIETRLEEIKNEYDEISERISNTQRSLSELQLYRASLDGAYNELYKLLESIEETDNG